MKQKRWLSTVLAGTMTLSLAACGGGGNGAEDRVAESDLIDMDNYYEDVAGAVSAGRKDLRDP